MIWTNGLDNSENMFIFIDNDVSVHKIQPIWQWFLFCRAIRDITHVYHVHFSMFLTRLQDGGVISSVKRNCANSLIFKDVDYLLEDKRGEIWPNGMRKSALIRCTMIYSPDHIVQITVFFQNFSVNIAKKNLKLSQNFKLD